MAVRRSPNDQAQIIALEVMGTLRRMVPELQTHIDRIFTIKFILHIRDGVATLLETDTFDDTYRNVPKHIAFKPDAEIVLKQIDTFLIKQVPPKLVTGYHGHIKLRVHVKQQAVAFAIKMRRQKKFD